MRGMSQWFTLQHAYVEGIYLNILMASRRDKIAQYSYILSRCSARVAHVITACMQEQGTIITKPQDIKWIHAVVLLNGR